MNIFFHVVYFMLSLLFFFLFFQKERNLLLRFEEPIYKNISIKLELLCLLERGLINMKQALKGDTNTILIDTNSSIECIEVPWWEGQVSGVVVVVFDEGTNSERTNKLEPFRILHFWLVS